MAGIALLSVDDLRGRSLADLDAICSRILNQPSPQRPTKCSCDLCGLRSGPQLDDFDFRARRLELLHTRRRALMRRLQSAA